MSNTMTSLLNCFTLFWYFATRVTKITSFTLLLLTCIQPHVFSNIFVSIELNSWGPFEIVFFFHYTVSIFQTHFYFAGLSKAAQKVPLLVPAFRSWLVATSSHRCFQEMKKQSEEVFCENSVFVNFVIFTLLPLTRCAGWREKIVNLSAVNRLAVLLLE